MLPRALWYYMEAMESCRFSQEELKKLQDRRLRYMIHHAYDNVPLYHGWFKSRGITPEDIRGVEDLKLLPTLSRQEIRENYPHGITASNRNATTGVKIRTTSGTTGLPIKIMHDARYHNLMFALKLRRIKWGVVSFTDRVANIIFTGPNEFPSTQKNNQSRVYKLLRSLAFGSIDTHWPTLRSKTFGIQGNVGNIVDDILRFNPNILYSRPSFLRRLGYLLQDKKLRVEKLISTSEVLSNGCRTDLEDLYNAEIYETYGSVEFGGMAIDCAQHSGMHLNCDYFIFEFLRDGEPVSPGEPGEVIITSLHNELMPLIRYRIGDIAILEEPDECKCGLAFPRLREVQGRLNDGLVSEDGIQIPPGTTVNYCESILGLRDYQLIQKDRRSVLVKLKPQSNTAQTRDALMAYLRNLLGPELNIELEIWEESQMPAKYRPVISNVS